MTALSRRLGSAVLSTALCLAALAGCGTSASWLGNNRAMTGLHARDLGESASRGKYQLFVLPDQGVVPVLHAIQGAKKSIKLTMYMFTNSNDSASLVNALIARQKAGVDVRVLLESQPFMPPKPPDCGAPQSMDLNRKAREALLAGGVNVKLTSPRFKYTHEKSMLIDDSTAWVMTTNFTGSAFNTNREYIVADRDPVDAAELSRIFEADWEAMPYTPGASNLVVSPDNSRRKLLDLIDSATKTLVLQSEFFSDPEVAAHLTARAKAGVDVTITLSYQRPDPCLGDTNADETKLVASCGISKLAFSKKLTMHAKTIIVDGVRAYVGSENLSANSLDNNREVGVIVDDPSISGQLNTIALRDYAANAATPPNVVPPAPQPGDNELL